MQEFFGHFSLKNEFRVVQKCANLVDLEKCCKMTIWLRKSVLIQPRTSLRKSDVSWRWIREPGAKWEAICLQIRELREAGRKRARGRVAEAVVREVEPRLSK